MASAFRTLSRGRGDANLSPTRSKTKKKKGGREQIKEMGGARKKRETGSHVARWPAFAFAYLLLLCTVPRVSAMSLRTDKQRMLRQRIEHAQAEVNVAQQQLASYRAYQQRELDEVRQATAEQSPAAPPRVEGSLLNQQGCLMTLQARLADDADLIEEHLGAHHRNFGCALFCCPNARWPQEARWMPTLVALRTPSMRRMRRKMRKGRRMDSWRTKTGPNDARQASTAQTRQCRVVPDRVS